MSRPHLVIPVIALPEEEDAAPEATPNETRARRTRCTGGTPVPGSQYCQHIMLGVFLFVLLVVVLALFYVFFKGIIGALEDSAPNYDIRGNQGNLI